MSKGMRWPRTWRRSWIMGQTPGHYVLEDAADRLVPEIREFLG